MWLTSQRASRLKREIDNMGQARRRADISLTDLGVVRGKMNADSFLGFKPARVGAIKQYSKTSSELCVFTVSTESHVALGQQGL